jgi:hypothetical protein
MLKSCSFDTNSMCCIADRPKRVAFSNIDRLVFAGLYCLAPQVLDALKILKPETVIRWHRTGFRAYWRWRSRPHGGRPGTPEETRELIRDMSIANPLWGAPRIHGELLKLGIDVGQTTRSPNTWRSVGGLHPRAGGRSCIIMLTASHRWTVRGSDHLFPIALWIADIAARSPTNPIAGSYRAPNGRVDRTSAHRGLRLDRSASIHHP